VGGLTAWPGFVPLRGWITTQRSTA
jgi:hypothetical protein